MAAPEPRDEQITAVIVATIAGIVAGEAYHYTPARIVRADFDELVNFDSFADPLVVIRPGDMQNQPRTTRGGHQTDLEIFATVAKRDTRLSPTAHLIDATSPTPQTVRARMTADVRKALEAWPGWGLGVSSVEVPARDSDVPIKGWCAAHLRILITYAERIT